MKPVVRFIDFFLYTSLFTTCCATGLCMATERLINGVVPPLLSSLHTLVFGSTLLVYNMPRIIRKPGGRAHAMQFRRWHFFLFFAGTLMAGAGLARMPLHLVLVSSILGIFAFAYFLPLLPFENKRRLRDFGWLKISVLASVWTIATSVLPMLYWQKDLMQYPAEILLRLLFIFTLCIIFDIRDMKTDRKNNIDTLPRMVGLENSYRLIDITLLLFVGCCFIQFFRYHETSRLVSSLITAIVTRVIAGFLRRQPSERAYLVLADGVMLVYALLVIIA